MKKSTTQNFSNRKLNNRLYQYKGGGYDGCFWEWNFFMFDTKGKFINIFTSGYAGIKNEKEAIQLIKNNEIKYRYNLSSHAHILELCNETNADLIKALQIFFNKENIDIKLICNCKLCKNETLVENTITTDPSSDGEIVISNKSLVCEDCYSKHSCSYCGEYSENLELYYFKNETKCEYCLTDNDILENIEYFTKYPTDNVSIERIGKLLDINSLSNIRLDLLNNIDILLLNVEDDKIRQAISDKREYQLNYYNKNQLSLDIN
jgi:hypothetical protein